MKRYFGNISRGFSNLSEGMAFMKKSQTFLEVPSENFQILDLSHEQVKNNGSYPGANSQHAWPPFGFPSSSYL
jgi:hypothetical protein